VEPAPAVLLTNRQHDSRTNDPGAAQYASLTFSMKSESLTLVSGLSLVIPLAFMMFSKDVPSELYPLPVIVAIPALLGLGYAATAGPMLLFFLWNPGLFRGEVKVPKRSSVLLVIATVLSVPWFVAGWKYGLQFQGSRYNYSVLAINVAWLAGLWAMIARSRKVEPSFRANLFLHWMLFAWLAWYAFPYLGELP
jgi:hypothetical protein